VRHHQHRAQVVPGLLGDAANGPGLGVVERRLEAHLDLAERRRRRRPGLARARRRRHQRHGRTAAHLGEARAHRRRLALAARLQPAVEVLAARGILLGLAVSQEDQPVHGSPSESFNA